MLNIIVNPYAGRGKCKNEAEKVARILDEKKIPYKLHYTEYPKHAAEIAHKLVLEGADAVVSAGGDGTLHEVVNGVISARKTIEKNGGNFKTVIGVLPCGTGNDFMTSVNLPSDVASALDRIIDGKPVPLDAIDVDGVYEICFACRGIDVDVVNMVNAGKSKTPSSYLKNILKCIFKGIKYHFEIIIDDKRIETTGIVAAVLNGSVLAGGLSFCPPASPFDGALDVIVIEKRNALKTLFHLTKLLKNKGFIDGKTVKHFTGSHVEIYARQDCIDVDGELYANKKFDAKIAPNILELII
ncbi:MAG: diacylglycerol kinase family lipid kinase [Eubacteriales bacterium]|nr:diacylglycerol kinase family lipid kinase [Eubacteriales bacterium]